VASQEGLSSTKLVSTDDGNVDDRAVTEEGKKRKTYQTMQHHIPQDCKPFTSNVISGTLKLSIVKGRGYYASNVHQNTVLWRHFYVTSKSI
jgi:hypothetical protein